MASGRERTARKGYTLGVLNGVLAQGAVALIRPETILAGLALVLTGSTTMVGLLVSIITASRFLTGTLASTYIQTMVWKKRAYILFAYIRVCLFLLLIVAIWFLAGDYPVVLFYVSLILLGGFFCTAGMSGVAFLDIVGKIIPSVKLGSFFAWRRTLGGILGLMGGFLASYILNEQSSGLGFPLNYVALFSVAWLLIIGFLLAFSLVPEPAGVRQRRKIGLVHELRRGPRLLQRDRDYRIFLLNRVSFHLSRVAVPFFLAYGLATLDVPGSVAGVYTALMTGGLLVSNPLWGRMSNVAGNRRLLLVSSLVLILSPLTVLVTPLIPIASAHISLLQTENTRQLFFLLAFLVHGFGLSGNQMGEINYLLELAPPRRRPTYIGAMRLFVLPAAFLPFLAGAIINKVSYEVIFAASAIGGLCSAFTAYRLGEPRESLEAPAVEEETFQPPAPGEKVAIQIRGMTRHDVKAVAELDRLCFPSPWSKWVYLSELAWGRRSYYIVAEYEGRIVGYAGNWIMGREMHITTIGVHPYFRRRKIAERMMLNIIHEAWQRGLEKISLEYRVSNKAAERLYEKYGFIQEGLRRGYYGDTGEDAVIATLYQVQSPELHHRIEELERELEESLNPD